MPLLLSSRAFRVTQTTQISHFRDFPTISYFCGGKACSANPPIIKETKTIENLDCLEVMNILHSHHFEDVRDSSCLLDVGSVLQDALKGCAAL